MLLRSLLASPISRRRSTQKLRLQQHINMRFSPLALVSTAAYSTTHYYGMMAAVPTVKAWSVPSGLIQRTRLISPFHTSTALASSSIAPEEIEVTSPPFSRQDPGSPIADGPIVSHFAGGLAAVRVDRDITQLAAKKDATVRRVASKKGDDLVGRLAKLPNGSLGVVIAQRPPMLFVYYDSTNNKTESLDGTVEIMNTMAEIDVGDDMRVVNCFGQQSVATKSDTAMGSHAIFAPIPKVGDIALINSPMLTGTTMVDVLAPIGKGQNMLIVGSDVHEMRDLACNFFKTQSNASDKNDIKCIYAATRDSDDAMQKLEALGILDDVIVVAARDNIGSEVAQAAEATAVAGTACAIAESFAKDHGQHALVIIDTLDYHKVLWDATTRVLVDIYGIDAVVTADREGGASSEMRAFYSSLVQRSAKYKKSKGGGSVTIALMTTVPSAQDDENTVFEPDDFSKCGDNIKTRLAMLVEKKIPLTAATLRKIKIPIPSVSEGKRRLVLQHVDDLISMSDGQIWLDEDLKQSPAVDPQRSITRVGIGADTDSRADAPAIRRIVEGVRLDLAQAANMDGAAANAATAKQIRKRDTWLLAMHQKRDEGRTLSESCVVLLAASMGALDDTVITGGTAGTEDGQRVITELLQHVHSRSPDVMSGIDQTFDMLPEARTDLEEAIRSYF